MRACPPIEPTRVHRSEDRGVVVSSPTLDTILLNNSAGALFVRGRTILPAFAVSSTDLA